MKFRLFIFCLFAMVSMARADWPVGKGRFVVLPGFNYFSTAGFFNKNGTRVPQGKDNSFSSYYFGVGITHGLARNLDIFTNVPYIQQNQVAFGTKTTRAGLGDVALGLAFHIPSESKRTHFTTRIAALIPTYTNTTTPFLGFGANGMQVVANYSFNPGNQQFTIFEVTHNRFFAEDGTGPNQFSGAITWGVNFNDYYMATANFTHMQSASADKTFSTNLPENKDFSYGKVTLGIGRKISRTVTPYLQGFYTVYGKNSGVGWGLGLSLITKMPF